MCDYKKDVSRRLGKKHSTLDLANIKFLNGGGFALRGLWAVVLGAAFWICLEVKTVKDSFMKATMGEEKGEHLRGEETVNHKSWKGAWLFLRERHQTAYSTEAQKLGDKEGGSLW